jgi:hypothetical protein
MQVSNDEFKFCKIIKTLYSCKGSQQIDSIRIWVKRLVFQDAIDFKSKLLVLCDEYERDLYETNT